VLLINFLYVISSFIGSHFFFVKNFFSSFFCLQLPSHYCERESPDDDEASSQPLHKSYKPQRLPTRGQHCSANGIIPFIPNHSTSESNHYSNEQEQAGTLAIKCTTFNSPVRKQEFFYLSKKKNLPHITTAVTTQQRPSDYINIMLCTATTHCSTI
jgi:hypothetical protein